MPRIIQDEITIHGETHTIKYRQITDDEAQMYVAEDGNSVYFAELIADNLKDPDFAVEEVDQMSVAIATKFYNKIVVEDETEIQKSTDRFRVD